MDDHQQIRDLMTRYCWLVDASEWDQWVELFTPDGSWRAGDFGPFEGHGGLKKLSGMLGKRVIENPGRHLAYNVMAEVDGDKGRLRSYLTVIRIATKEMVTIGEYDIAVVKQGGQWLMDKLEFNRLA